MVADVSKAARVAHQAHHGQTDKAGLPYVWHPIRVANAVLAAGGDLDQMAVAYLHDVVEDTDWTVEDVRRRFGDRIAEAVDALTRRDGEPYDVYIDRVSANRDALLVKNHDIADNLTPARQKALPEADQARLTRKYRNALAQMEGHRGNSTEQG